MGEKDLGVKAQQGKGGKDLRKEQGEALRGGKGLRGERGKKDLSRERGGGEKIQKGDLKELKIISVFFLSTSEKHIEKPSIK